MRLAKPRRGSPTETEVRFWVGTKMTHIEKMRLQAALKALTGVHVPAARVSHNVSHTERSAARGLRAEEGRAVAGTE